MPNYSIQVYPDAGGEWRWRLVAGNGEKVADSAESYTRKADALEAAENVRTEAGLANIMEADA